MTNHGRSEHIDSTYNMKFLILTIHVVGVILLFCIHDKNTTPDKSNRTINQFTIWIKNVSLCTVQTPVKVYMYWYVYLRSYRAPFDTLTIDQSV